MRQRLSISRLMATIALLGASLGLLKSWVGPQNLFGFLGLLGWMVFSLGIACFATAGSARRFFAGAGLTGLTLLIAVVLAPGAIVGLLWNWLFYPILRVSASNSVLNEYLYRWYFVELNLKLSGWLEIRTSIGTGLPDLQAILLIPFASLAVLGGLIAALARRNRIFPEASPTT